MNTTPKYTLPPPVYLPSSGGYTNSRLTQEPFHRRVFAFRRWSIDEDGRLVCRTKHAGRDLRPKPYDRPSRPVAFSTPNDQDARKTTHEDRSTRTNIDGPTLSRLFQNLAPLVKETSLDFDSKATVICASLGLDPVTSKEIVSSFKMQFAESSPPNHPPPASGANTETIVQRTSPNTGLSTSAPVPSTSAAASSFPTAPTPSNLTPFKQQRTFSSGSPGVTTWYTTSTASDIASPPRDIAPAIGDLYVHHNRLTDIYHVWLWEIDHKWKCVTDMEKVYHPAIDDRVLSMRANGTPNWITAASFTTIRGRKGKARVFE
ncbi:hypothetical protein BJ322DRAFT_1103524 [Thelephora terrestris]|uniref:Uncharacterized protein n=1 Tax=Thelephora terrestris TaxID=56493 RepID=A0A9P6HRU0_9AGAM|nr:hypothetical protein BJ322DRAFT_1103524 [Thelephora terrestris]